MEKYVELLQDIFDVSVSAETMECDEESLAFVKLRASVLLNEKELEKLIEKLTETKNFLNEKNKTKNIK